MAVNCPFATSALLFCSPLLFAAAVELNVVGDRVNLRSRPEAEAEVVGQVSTGEKLMAPDGVPEGADWIKVSPPQAVDLWIFSSLVTDGIVNADDTYVRCGPGPQFRFVGKLQRGDKVTPRGAQSGDWLRIAPVPSAALYISSAYVLAIPAEPEQAAPADEPVADEVPQPEETQVEAETVPEATAEAVAEKKTVAEVESPVAVPAEESVPSVTASTESEAVVPDVSSGAVSNTEGAVEAVEPEAVEEPVPVVPQVLAGYSLASTQKQGVPVKIIGRLERDSSAVSPNFSRYLLVDKAGNAKSSVICRVIGLTGQLYELRGSEIEVDGRIWTLAGDAVPILDATSIYRIASWER